MSKKIIEKKPYQQLKLSINLIFFLVLGVYLSLNETTKQGTTFTVVKV